MARRRGSPDRVEPINHLTFTANEEHACPSSSPRDLDGTILFDRKVTRRHETGGRQSLVIAEPSFSPPHFTLGAGRTRLRLRRHFTGAVLADGDHVLASRFLPFDLAREIVMAAPGIDLVFTTLETDYVVEDTYHGVSPILQCSSPWSLRR